MAGLILKVFNVHPVVMTTPHLFNELLLATELEAKPILVDGEMGWAWDKLLSCYSSSRHDLRLWVTGIGPTRSAYEMGRLMPLAKGKFLNLGVVGALSDLPVGGMFQVERVVSNYERHPFDRRDDELELSTVDQMDVATACCVSVGEAVHDEVSKARLCQIAELVDMELYALGACSKWVKRELSSVKIVSDFASEADAKEIVKRIPQLMTELWKAVRPHVVASNI